MEKIHSTVLTIVFFTVAISIFTAAFTGPKLSFLVLAVSSVCLAVLAVFSLSFIDPERSTDGSVFKRQEIDKTALRNKTNTLIWTTRLTGITAAAYFLALPYYTPGGPLGECIARALCFACACKTLDLTVARAGKPPKRMKNENTIPTTDSNRWQYIWLLLRECRYRSFDIAIIEKDREGPASKFWTFGPGIVLPLLIYFVPCSETRVLLTLVFIHAGMEFCHTVLHPSSKSRLFWQPFAAGTVSAFWRTHWQQDAASFLYSLAYVPARDLVGKRFGRQAGRAAGVMAAFNLSGIWHGWAAAVLTTTPWRSAVGMWALFIMHGGLCLLEGKLGRRGGWVQKGLAWAFAVWSTGAWMRDSERNLSVPVLRRLLG